MTNKFIKPNNSILYQKTKLINKQDLQSKWFLDIIEEMKNTAGIHQHNAKNKAVMVGLAAPQIGHSVQLVFVDTSASLKRDGKYGSNIFMINPKILSKSKSVKKGREGCYSTKGGECDYNGIVERHTEIKVKYMNLEGLEIIENYNGFTAIIIQHEIDHLNGKVFIHKIKSEKDLHIVFPSEVQNYRENFKKWKRNLDPKLYWKHVAEIKK